MISGYFGLPGSGKTSFMTMIAQKELRRIQKGKSRYKYILTNYECKGCYRVDYHVLGRYDIRDALILLDEITQDADSRDFKTFSKQQKYFFAMHRHYKCDVIYFCQQYDGLDKKIRDQTQELWYVKKLGPWSIASRIFRVLEINELSYEIVQGYRFADIWEKLFSLFPFSIRILRFCFRPFWYKYFDSWQCDPLPDFKLERW